MPRKTSTHADLQDTLEQLDNELARPEIRISAVKALETKITVLNDLLKREIDAKQDDVEQENVKLKDELTRFRFIDPEKVAAQSEELRSTRAQLESARSSNNSYSREVATLKTENAQTTTLLKWLCEQVQQNGRMRVALRCFVEKHAAGKPIIDVLMGNDTTAVWTKLTHSKTGMIQKVRELRQSPDQEDKNTVSFLLQFAKDKHGLDIDQMLKDEAAENFKREMEEDASREARRQAMEFAMANRVDHREEEIRRHEAMNDPRSRIVESW